MDAPALSNRIAELEQVEDHARDRWRAARAVADCSCPQTSDLHAWKQYGADVAEAVNALADLTMVGEHLTAAAELEQALKEERWGMVAHWSKKLEAFQPPVPAVHYLIQCTSAEMGRVAYWRADGVCPSATTNRAHATRYLDPIAAAVAAPAGWYSETGEALFTIEEVTD